jgi:hypothetical protein
MDLTIHSWRNCLTGAETLDPPDGQPLGVWRYTDGKPWCGLDSNATGIPEALLPKAHHENTLLSISKAIDGSDKHAWGDWCNRLPLDSNLRDKLVEKREEAALGSAMPHLEEICRDPRGHLTVCELREPVSRARRIPPRAISLLSAHSEDWYSRTFRSVRPKAVLSEVIEDEWAIYENRALRTLRGQILESFTPRLLELRELLSAIDRSSDESALGYRFRIIRLCLLLSELLQNQEERDLLRSLVARLSSIHKSLLGLGGSFLLKAIRQSPPVASPLRPTNILRDDKRYRKVFELWHLWERRDEEKITRAERLTKLSKAMDRYTAILCARAFSLLQMVSETERKQAPAQHFEPGAMPVKLKRGWSFTWNMDGTFSLLRPDKQTALKIVAIPSQIERLPLSLVAEMAFSEDTTKNNGPPVLILTLGKLDNPPATWPQELAEWYQIQGRSLTILPKRILLEVSPSRLDPVEHVARVLRRVIAETDWPELPLKANLPPGLATVSRELSHAVPALFSNAPSLAQISEVADRLQKTTSEITAIQDRLDAIGQIQRGRVGHSTKDLAQEKSRLQSEMPALKAKLDVWQKLLPELERIRSVILPALVCPCCGHETTHPPNASMFSCSFGPSCKTRWGKRPDATGTMHVFLMPNGEDPDDLPEGQYALDRYGADFL